MATLEDVLTTYEVQKIIIPILEKHVMDDIMRLDLSLSGTTPASWDKNILLTTSVRDNLSWNDEVRILTPDLAWDVNYSKKRASDSLRGICYIIKLMLDHPTD